MRTEVAARLKQLRTLLEQRGGGALAVFRQNNFAWATGGARGFINTSMDAAAACILVSRNAAVVIAARTEAGRLLTEELDPGWEIAAYDWWEEGQPGRLIRELAGGDGLLADMPWPGAGDVGTDVAALRWTLCPEEQARAQTLGREVALAFEAVAREITPGMTEHAVAAEISRALVIRGIEPQVKLVAFDWRSDRWRHPLPTDNRLSRYALLCGCGQRHGLVISVTRLVHFGTPPLGLRRRLDAAAGVFAALTRACRPGAPVHSLFAAARDAYAAAGWPDGWREHHLGGLSAYVSREYRVAPDSPHHVGQGQLFAWNPTLPGVKCEDVFLVTGDGPEMITDTGAWPRLGPERAHAAGLLVRRARGATLAGTPLQEENARGQTGL